MSSFVDDSGSDSRDPEDRPIDERDPFQVREKMLDKTLADSFPASDPPSSDPAPTVDPFAPKDLSSLESG